MVRSKILFLIAVCLLSFVFIFLTRAGDYKSPLSSFVDHPLWFLGSFLVQPAFCSELFLQKYFDLSAILAFVINISFFTYAAFSPWMSRKPFVLLFIQNYKIGLVLNFGNFVLALMRSA
jgi:hypothetical protein